MQGNSEAVISAEPIISTDPDRLSWVEICARYPNEWVVLVDFDWIDDDDDEFRTAIVLHHGTGRDTTIRDAAPCKRRGYLDFAHYYTGRVRGPWHVEYDSE